MRTKRFTMYNTEGFKQKDLDEMNIEFNFLMIGVSEEYDDYNQIAQRVEEFILRNRY